MVGARLRRAEAGVDKSGVTASLLERRTDADLMGLLQRGHAEALRPLHARHDGVAFALAYRIVGDSATAEEVVQDAFLTLWRECLRYEAERGTVRSWVLGIVHHRAIDTLRRKQRFERREAVGDIHESQPGHDFTQFEVARRELVRQTWAELGSLPSEQQEVIKLAFLGELTSGEIAETLGLPLGTVKGRLRLGLQKLRKSVDTRARLEELAV